MHFFNQAMPVRFRQSLDLSLPQLIRARRVGDVGLHRAHRIAKNGPALSCRTEKPCVVRYSGQY